MAVFFCGVHGDGCRREHCLDRAYIVRMAMNGVRDGEPRLPLTELVDKLLVKKKMEISYD